MDECKPHQNQMSLDLGDVYNGCESKLNLPTGYIESLIGWIEKY